METEIQRFTSKEDLLKESEILAMRQISDTLKRVSEEMVLNRADMGEIKVDIAIMKERQDQNKALKESMDAMQKEIDELKARNLKEDGGVAFLTFLKDFGPWFMALLMAYLALFKN